MLWIQGFHVIFVVCWFAGIFYLPRLLVYYAQSPEPEPAASCKRKARAWVFVMEWAPSRRVGAASKGQLGD